MSGTENTSHFDKVKAVIGGLLKSEAGTDLLESALEVFGRKMLTQATIENFIPCTDQALLAAAHIGIILDVETTGLDDQNDEIIELAMLKVRYDEGGILAIEDVFDEFNQPSTPISAEITKITGITNEMVEGHKITEDQIISFIDGVEISVAHNAGFDRKFCEANYPNVGFDRLDWHCSIAQIDWPARGKNGRALEVLAISEGLVYGSHRADADCIATAFVLNGKGGDKTPFAEMMKNGKNGTLHLIAKGAPFDSKDVLKSRGYMWSADGKESNGHIKVWHRELPNDPKVLEEEAKFMRDEVFGRDASLPSYFKDPKVRFSARDPGAVKYWKTAEAENLKQEISMMSDPMLPGL